MTEEKKGEEPGKDVEGAGNEQQGCRVGVGRSRTTKKSTPSASDLVFSSKVIICKNPVFRPLVVN